MMKSRQIILLIILIILTISFATILTEAQSTGTTNETAGGAGGATPGDRLKVQWSGNFGGSGNDTGSAISLASDGGFIIAGNTYSSGNGGSDVFVIKTDANGNKLWEKTFGGGADDEAFAVLQARDGNYVVAGYTISAGNGSADGYLLKIDPDGNRLWEKTFGDTAEDYIFSLGETPDGGYVLAGYTDFPPTLGGNEAWLIRTDDRGNLQWQKTYGGPADDQFNCINVTTDGGYLLVGWTRSFSNSQDFYIVRTDARGELLWQYKYPWGGDPRTDVSSSAYSALQLPNGNYFIDGWYFRNGESYLRYMQLDQDGKVVSGVNATTGRSFYDTHIMTNFNREPHPMTLTSDGEVMITGPQASASGKSTYILLMKMNTSNGIHTRGGTSHNVSANDSSRGIVQTPQGGYAITGWTYKGNGNSSDVLLMKVDYSGRAAAAPVAQAQPDIVRPAAAVAVGTGLGFLGLFWGRIQEFLAAVYAKLQLALKPLIHLFNKMFPVDTILDFVKGYVKTYAKAFVFKQEAKIEVVNAVERVAFMAGFSSIELLVILITSIFLGLAFLITKKMGFDLGNITLYLVVAGLATILHDLSHRYFAYRYKVTAEYKFWPLGTFIMFITAFLFGTAYGSPARTLINDQKKLGLKEQAIIALGGPMMSFLVTIAFFLLVPIGGWFRVIGLLGVSMNLLSAVYGLMPFDPADGNKVYRWRKLAWAIVFVPLFIAYLLAAIYLI